VPLVPLFGLRFSEVFRSFQGSFRLWAWGSTGPSTTLEASALRSLRSADPVTVRTTIEVTKKAGKHAEIVQLACEVEMLQGGLASSGSLACQRFLESLEGEARHVIVPSQPR
jgi:hypothetical protein